MNEWTNEWMNDNKKNSQFAVGVSQRLIGDTATIGKFRAKVIRS